MSTFDNAAPLDDWSLPPRCCGTWVQGVVCQICQQYIPPGPHCVLGEE